jgi:transcriptional regulator with PAS, ATPase and Fis domain
VISATNADLVRGVADGSFRKDLFYRINVIEADIRPLRERPEDIPDLVGHFYRRRGLDEPELARDARHVLVGYSWPGNIRELENELERLIALFDAPSRITPGMFSPRVAEEAGGTKLDVRVLRCCKPTGTSRRRRAS